MSDKNFSTETQISETSKTTTITRREKKAHFRPSILTKSCFQQSMYQELA